MATTLYGWTLVTLPSSPPAPKDIEWGLTDVEGANRSPFNLSQQFYDWDQGILRASLSYPPMSKANAAAWEAFLMSCVGISNVFLFGDPTRLGPINSSASGGTVTGSGQTGRVLECSATNMSPGDWIQIGVRLHRVLAQNSGSLSIWPPIRESPTGGTSIVITNTQGLFRLSKNERKYSVKVGQIYSVTFEIEEAL